MSGYEGDPTALVASAMQQVLSGEPAVAIQTLNRALALDHGDNLPEDDIVLVRCMIALVEREPRAAREHASRLCRSSSGRDTLRQVLRSSQDKLPAGTERLLGDLAREPEEAKRSLIHSLKPRMAAIGALVISVAAIGGWWLVGGLSRGEASSDGREAQLHTSQQPLATSAASQRMKTMVGLLVVRVRLQRQGSPEQLFPVATGTAFTVSRDGLLMTSKHVFEDFIGMQPTTFAGSDLQLLGCDLLVAFGPEPEDWFPVRVVHSSSYLDLAVLRIERATEDYLRFASSSSQGDDVRSIGFPTVASELFEWINQEASLERLSSIDALITNGQIPELDDVLSADRFAISMFKGSISAMRATEKGRFVQTDANMYQGMSGGPLVNERMEVIGVITFTHTQVEGINAALAVSSIRDDLQDLKGIPWP